MVSRQNQCCSFFFFNFQPETNRMPNKMFNIVGRLVAQGSTWKMLSSKLKLYRNAFGEQLPG